MLVQFVLLVLKNWLLLRAYLHAALVEIYNENQFYFKYISAGISVLLILHVNLGVLQHTEQARATGLCGCTGEAPLLVCEEAGRVH